jgi:TolB protein
MKRIMIFIFLTFSLFAEELQVHLATKVPLSIVYLSKVIGSGDLDEGYLSQVRGVLEYDLNNSGYIYSTRENKSDAVLAINDLQKAFNPGYWSKENYSLIVKLEIQNKKLNVYVFDTLKNKSFAFSTINLIGNLNVDRRKMHELNDRILEDFFQKKGYAEKRIIYSVRKENSQNNHKWTSEIWVCDSDGQNAKQLTFENSYCVHPLFLSSKKEIPDFIYVSYKDGIPKIYSSKGAKGSKLISLRGNQLLPALSKQKDQITFICDAAGSPDLFLQKIDKDFNANGKPLQLYSCARATQATSSFSPSGKELAFVSDKDGSPRIYLLKIPQSNTNDKRPNAQLITKKNRDNVTPSFSSDGTKLAFSATTEGVRQIWVYDFSSDDEWQLTTGPGNKENPFWADDNLHIVYNTEDKSSSEMYIINLNQQKPLKISSGLGQKRFPAWER